MRISTFSSFSRMLLGMRTSQLELLHAQDQLSSGRRILRPSDDPTGTARALSLRRTLARSEQIQAGADTGRQQLDLATSTLQHSSELLTRTRELLLQGLNGTLNGEDRDTLASEIGEIRKQLLDDANLRFDDGYVFGGTRVGDAPWSETTGAGHARVVYLGNDGEQRIRAGESDEVGITIDGDGIFGGGARGPARFDGLTGLSAGTTADEGQGYNYIVLRHDGTDTGLLGSVGVSPLDGGDGDTLLGVNDLVIDSSTNTVRLGSGPAVTIPSAGSREDVVVRNEKGGVLHLDFEGWSGADYSSTVTGRGSISFDGDTFQTLDYSETDLELRNPDQGQVVHVATANVRRAGSELVTFGDTTNAFDLLQGIVDDLHNAQGLAPDEVQARLSQRLADVDRVHDGLLNGIGVLGGRSARLTNAGTHQGEVGLELQSRLSQIENADFSEVALDFTRSQTILQVVQAAGARVIQTSLLNFLR